MSDQACCAHLTVKWTTEPCDGENVRGEVTPGTATRGWWECPDCRTKFVPVRADLTAEVQRLRGELFAETQGRELLAERDASLASLRASHQEVIRVVREWQEAYKEETRQTDRSYRFDRMVYAEEALAALNVEGM